MVCLSTQTPPVTTKLKSIYFVDKTTLVEVVPAAELLGRANRVLTVRDRQSQSALCGNRRAHLWRPMSDTGGPVALERVGLSNGTKDASEATPPPCSHPHPFCLFNLYCFFVFTPQTHVHGITTAMMDDMRRRKQNIQLPLVSKGAGGRRSLLRFLFWILCSDVTFGGPRDRGYSDATAADHTNPRCASIRLSDSDQPISIPRDRSFKVPDSGSPSPRADVWLVRQPDSALPNGQRVDREDPQYSTAAPPHNRRLELCVRKSIPPFFASAR